MDSGIQCYFQKKLSRTQALELLSKNMPQNDDERIIFTEGQSQPYAETLAPGQPESSAAASQLSPITQDLKEASSSMDEHSKLKHDFQNLKSKHEQLERDFASFKEETEHKIQQLFFAVSRPFSAEDSVTNGIPKFFEVSKMRKNFPVQIHFFDQPSKKVDLAEVLRNSPRCKDGITGSKEIADLFKDVLWKIFQRENIHRYTAASSRVKKGLTPISQDTIEAIRTLIYEGFSIDRNVKDTADIVAKRHEVDKIIKSTSSYLFNNSRRSRNQNSPRNSVHGYYEDQASASQQRESDSDSEDIYPKRMRIETLDDCFKYEPDAEY